MASRAVVRTFIVLIACCAPVLAAAAAFAAEPEKVDVFVSGEGGYREYRIPGIVVTAKGTVLAYCEVRKGPGGDWATIDVFLRRSTDGGRTWDVPRQVAHSGPRIPKNPVALAKNKQLTPDSGQTVNNPVALVDHKTGAVHFLYCVEYAKCFYMRSNDDGVTFSKPVEITSTFEKYRPTYPWRMLATGPGHGIQLKGGRLVVPIWMSARDGEEPEPPSVASTIYSDDAGRTWHAGEIATPPGAGGPSCSESVVVELADGRVLLNCRNQSPAKRRLVTISPDGATGWSKPRHDDALLEPVCMGSIARFSREGEADRNRILFANPHNLEALTDPNTHAVTNGGSRVNVSVKLSYDEGLTWPVNKTLEAGRSAYSDLAVLPDGTALCLYERAKDGAKGRFAVYGRLTLARFGVEWLTEGKDVPRK